MREMKSKTSNERRDKTHTHTLTRIKQRVIIRQTIKIQISNAVRIQFGVSVYNFECALQIAAIAPKIGYSIIE